MGDLQTCIPADTSAFRMVLAGLFEVPVEARRLQKLHVPQSSSPRGFQWTSHTPTLQAANGNNKPKSAVMCHQLSITFQTPYLDSFFRAALLSNEMQKSGWGGGMLQLHTMLYVRWSESQS
jgi:hypothetical protein